MKISWVVADGYQFDPTVDVDVIKDIGSIWGSWTTWRGCGTDNVICNTESKALDLIERSFHKGCNFYIPNKTWTKFNCPTGVQSYGGEFEHEIQWKCNWNPGLYLITITQESQTITKKIVVQ